MQDLLNQLVAMTAALGDPAREYAILGEGNTSARLDDASFLVKASGYRMQNIDPAGFVRVRLDRCIDLLSQSALDDAGVRAGLQACRFDADCSLMPSVETVLHALLLQLPGARFVGHTHPIACNAILCSEKAHEAFRGRVFPDEIVCCGVAPCLVDYVDPGLPLARAVRDAVARYGDEYGETPKLIALLNHGIFAVGSSPNDVLATTDMFVKVCRILVGAYAMGGPRFLTPENVDRIHTRPDEHYRQRQLGVRASG